MLPGTSQPGDVLFSPDGRKLILTCVATSLIDSFTVGRGGLLSAAPSSPFAAEGLHAFDSEFRPTDAAQLDVTNAQDGANAGTVSALAVNTASGSISSYSIATGSSLTLLRSTSVIAAATPDDARLSPGWHHPLGRRLHGRRRQWFCRQRWWTHRTADFADARCERGRTHRHRCQERFIAREANHR